MSSFVQCVGEALFLTKARVGVPVDDTFPLIGCTWRLGLTNTYLTAKSAFTSIFYICFFFNLLSCWDCSVSSVISVSTGLIMYLGVVCSVVIFAWNYTEFCECMLFRWRNDEYLLSKRELLRFTSVACLYKDCLVLVSLSFFFKANAFSAASFAAAAPSSSFFSSLSGEGKKLPAYFSNSFRITSCRTRLSLALLMLWISAEECVLLE